jgi:DNA-binding XRE family transcriptional regulator
MKFFRSDLNIVVPKTKLGEFFRNQRIAKGYSRNDVGALIAVSRSSITFIEGGDNSVNLSTAVLLSRLYGFDLGELDQYFDRSGRVLK